MTTEPIAPVVDSQPEAWKPGIYPNVPYERYHGIDAVSHSRLEGFKRTPAHAREEMLHPRESKDLAFGQAFHVLVLEPERFVQRYAVPPKVDRRFTEGKKTWAAFEAANQGKLLITKDEFDAMMLMRESVNRHPCASDLLKGAIHKELTFLWNEDVEGETVLCKGREDIIAKLGGWAWIVNLKTTYDASERSFAKDIFNFGYFRASGWYRRGLKTLGPGERRVAYIAVEKDPPYAVAVHELDERAIDQGERDMVSFLGQYVRCRKANAWPAYDDGMGLLDLPSWAVDKLDL